MGIWGGFRGLLVMARATYPFVYWPACGIPGLIVGTINLYEEIM